MSRHELTSFCGVVPALLTPFAQDGALDLPRLRNITRHLLARGVHGLYLTGSTGEGFMMSPDEREQVVETVIDEAAGAVPIVVHVGAISTHVSAGLARHAQAAGADGISSVPPIYWQFTADQVFAYYAELTASTDLPMIAYNVPMASLGYDLLLRLAQIKGMAGVKYTATTHFDIMRLKEDVGPDFLVFSGADEMAISGLAFGADGIIGSFYNLVPELYLDLMSAMTLGDLARAQALQRTANAVIFETLKEAPLASMKAMMGWAGADAGWARAPHDNLDDAAREALKARFRALRDTRGLTGLEILDSL